MYYSEFNNRMYVQTIVVLNKIWDCSIFRGIEWKNIIVYVLVQLLTYVLVHVQVVIKINVHIIKQIM